VSLDAAGLALRKRVLAAFTQPIDQSLADQSFDALARDIFAWQLERNRPLAAYCGRRGISAASLSHWTEIPPIPTAAFKEVPLLAGKPSAAETVFRTSGTTRGTEKRGTHYILDLSIYHAALLPIFVAWLMPDGVRPTMLSLVPPPHELPDSSLAHMIATVIQHVGAHGSGWFASVQGGIHQDELAHTLRDAVDGDLPVCLLGTSFSFVHWTDGLRARGERYTLPMGSRLMDTGGSKGKSREVSADALRATYGELLGIPAEACINEYGMTEMTSQFYDSTLRLPGPRRKIAPPWVRTRVVDPDTLAPCATTRPGLLQHFDLANLGSVMCVQTEDLGIIVDDGFQVLGRAAGAQPRGCSIAMDELLSATRAGG
jgi:hypothetical protein